MSDDEIVHLNSFKPQMDNDSGQDIPDGHPAIQVIEQTNAAADAS